MKKKKLYLILPILVAVIFLSTGPTCYEFFGRERAEFEAPAPKDEAEEAEQAALLEEAKVKAAEYDAAKEEVVEQAAPTEDVAEETAVTEEDVKIIPNEPITYSTNMDGAAVILIVNFKTTEVTGSISLSGVTSVDATINGKIDINTFEITSNYSGIMVVEEAGEYPFNGTITGKITDDLSTFNGEILNDEGKGRKITATK